MNDCKITKEFIRLESSKRSYCNIVKLILPNKDMDKEPEIVNKPTEIRNKMAEHFQEILNHQNIDKNPNCIADFLLADNNPKPFEELLCRQLSEELKQELEGPLTLNELEESLFKYMKPNSVPGIY